MRINIKHRPGAFEHTQKGSLLSICLAIHRDTTWNLAIIRHTVTMQGFCLHTPCISCKINLGAKITPWGLVVCSCTQVQNRRRKHVWNSQHCPGSPRSVAPKAEPGLLRPCHPPQPLSFGRGLSSSFLFQTSVHFF